MNKPRLVEFGRVDETADPGHFIRFLDTVCAEASAQAYKKKLIELLGLHPGLHVLDVGCGTGDDARTMARILAPGGSIVGVDNSRAMITEAQRRAAGASLPVEFRQADVTQLPFAADHFDGVQADRSLMHVPDLAQALAEMMRVTKPGGRVAVYEVDFETLTIDVADCALARKISRTWGDGFRDGWRGRRIPGLLADLGLRGMRVVPHTLTFTPAMALPLIGPPTVERALEQGTINGSEAADWLEQLEELQRSGRWFCTLTGFLVAGHK